MRVNFLAVLAVVLLPSIAQAGGWDYVRRHPEVLGSRNCGFGGRPVIASHYGRGDGFHGRRAADGSRFDAGAHTFASNDAAGRHVPFGQSRTFTNPRNGRSVTARSTDRGPFGPAHALGAHFDLSTGTAHAIGMSSSQWVCVSGG